MTVFIKIKGCRINSNKTQRELKRGLKTLVIGMTITPKMPIKISPELESK